VYLYDLFTRFRRLSAQNLHLNVSDTARLFDSASQLSLQACVSENPSSSQIHFPYSIAYIDIRFYEWCIVLKGAIAKLSHLNPKANLTLILADYSKSIPKPNRISDLNPHPDLKANPILNPNLKPRSLGGELFR